MQLWTTDGVPHRLRSFAGLLSLFGNPEAVQAIAFSPDGRLLAASDDDKAGPIGTGEHSDDYANVAVWQAATGRLLASPSDLNASLGHVTASGNDLVAFSPDAKLLAMSMFDRSILILDARTGAIRQVISSVDGATALAFAPDGTLVAGTPAGTVERWNPRTGDEIGSPLVAAASPVTSIAFDPSGASFVTAGEGSGAVKLWLSSKLQQEGPTLNTDPGATSTVAFEPHGDRMIAVDDHGRAVTWPTSISAWERSACAVAGRNLTPGGGQLITGPSYAPVCP